MNVEFIENIEAIGYLVSGNLIRMVTDQQSRFLDFREQNHTGRLALGNLEVDNFEYGILIERDYFFLCLLRVLHLPLSLAVG